jgi:hypothetical protein
MEEQRDPKKALEGKPGGRRKRGKPQKRWIDNVEDDLRKMGVKRWRVQTADRKEWREICEAAKVLQELQRHGVAAVVNVLVCLHSDRRKINWWFSLQSTSSEEQQKNKRRMPSLTLFQRFPQGPLPFKQTANKHGSLNMRFTYNR